MEVNWLIIGAVAISAIALIAYLIKQNRKDKEKVEEDFNNDYKGTIKKDSELNDEDN